MTVQIDIDSEVITLGTNSALRQKVLKISFLLLQTNRRSQLLGGKKECICCKYSIFKLVQLEL